MSTNDTFATTPSSAGFGAGDAADADNYSIRSNPLSNGARYGEVSNGLPPISEPLVTETHTKTSINWGGVVKGVAIIAAVVVVGVVGYMAFNALAAAAIASPTFGPAIGTISAAASQAATAITGYLGQAGAFLAELHPLSWLGLSGGTAGTALSGTAAISATHAAAVVGGSVAAAAALPTALDHINHISLTQTSTVTTPVLDTHALQDNSILATQGAHLTHGVALISPHTLHELTHISHHAAEHHTHEHTAATPRTLSIPQPHITDALHRRATDAMLDTQHATRSWMDRTGAHPVSAASHADAVRAQQSAKPPLQARDTNFAAQLDADRAQLETALAK